MDGIRKLEIEMLQTEHVHHQAFSALTDILPKLEQIRDKGVGCCYEQKLVMGCLSYAIGSIHLQSAKNFLEELKIKQEDDDNE